MKNESIVSFLCFYFTLDKHLSRIPPALSVAPTRSVAHQSFISFFHSSLVLPTLVVVFSGQTFLIGSQNVLEETLSMEERLYVLVSLPFLFLFSPMMQSCAV